jgi:hypothetical protein
LDDSNIEDLLFDDDVEKMIMLLAMKELEDRKKKSCSTIFASQEIARSATTCSCIIIGANLSASSISPAISHA